MNPLVPFLEHAGVVILDGGLATELERRGADLNDPLWSARVLLERPELIRQVHLDYFRAGADVATSASYQATLAGFARRGLSRLQAADLMRLSVRLAQEARELFWAEAGRGEERLRPLVAASIGCYGAYRHDGSEYRGDYDLDVAGLIEFHRPRLEILADAGPDLLACETIPCRQEAEALVRLLGEFPHLPAWLSFSCKDQRHVCHGETLAECVALAEEADSVVAVGVNCTPAGLIDGLLRTLAGRTRKLLLAYPNSGETWNAGRQAWEPTDELTGDWGQAARRWHDAGARLLGGCCRTTPAVIAQMARGVRSSDQPW